MTPRKRRLARPLGCVCGNQSCQILFGFCHCECGRRTTLSCYQQPKDHLFRGLPNMFCYGHKRASRRHPESIGPFKIDGVYCCLLPLNSGQWAVIDAEDFGRISGFTWRAVWKKKCNTFYAVTNPPRQAGQPRKSITLHRLLLGVGQGEDIDHRNHNGLDNRRRNLRPCSDSDNNGNMVLSSANTSGYKGVFWHERRKRWIAGVQREKKVYRREFKKVEDAVSWHREMTLVLFGDFANPSGELESSQPHLASISPQTELESLLRSGFRRSRRLSSLAG